MSIVAEYLSTDGALRFLVVKDEDGDISLGFDGFSWHTHAEILAEISGLSEVAAVRRFVDDLLGDRSIIAVLRVADEPRDVWVSEDPARDAVYPIEGETIELRYWSGRTWAPSSDPG